MVNVAILGAGFMGKVHAECYSNLSKAKLVAVADIDQKKADELAKKYNACSISQPNKVIEDENIHLIDICLPTFLHKEYAIKAAQAGKHILCEKPIALRLEDADEMIEEAKKAGVKFMVAQVIRFWPEYVKLKQIYQEGTLGKLLSLSLTRLGLLPTWSWNKWMLDPEKSGGAILDLHIHDTDYLLLVAFVEGGWDIVADEFPFTMTYRAIFEKGVIEFNNRKEMTLSVYSKGKKVEHPSLQDKLFPLKNFGGNISDIVAYFLEIKYFVECIENDTSPILADATSARDSLEVLLLERKSAEEGKVVELK